MEELDYTELDPIEKISEIRELFKEYESCVYSRDDEGYDWLEYDDSKCLVFNNSFSENCIQISVDDEDEFTLYFAGYHCHFPNYKYAYDEMVGMVKEILTNNACAVVLTDKNGKWYGSSYFSKEDSSRADEESLSKVFSDPALLENDGYETNFIFWNPIDNKSIVKGGDASPSAKNTGIKSKIFKSLLFFDRFCIRTKMTPARINRSIRMLVDPGFGKYFGWASDEGFAVSDKPFKYTAGVMRSRNAFAPVAKGRYTIDGEYTNVTVTVRMSLFAAIVFYSLYFISMLGALLGLYMLIFESRATFQSLDDASVMLSCLALFPILFVTGHLAFTRPAKRLRDEIERIITEE